MQECRDFRVTGKVDLAHVVQADNAGQVSGAFDYNPIFSAFDSNAIGVGSMEIKLNTSKSGNTASALKKRFFQKYIRNLIFEV